MVPATTKAIPRSNQYRSPRHNGCCLLRVAVDSVISPDTDLHQALSERVITVRRDTTGSNCDIKIVGAPNKKGAERDERRGEVNKGLMEGNNWELAIDRDVLAAH
ncbi:hypothetical protein J6590_033550 [Homalodisca vitripennis]|nr:hypothetical protein J6590_033550 [Homalodisca vitripennis]